MHWPLWTRVGLWLTEIFFCPPSQDYPCSQAFFAVYDGHSGVDAANYAATHLHCHLARNSNITEDPGQALKEAFEKTDECFVEKAKREVGWAWRRNIIYFFLGEGRCWLGKCLWWDQIECQWWDQFRRHTIVAFSWGMRKVAVLGRGWSWALSMFSYTCHWIWGCSCSFCLFCCSMLQDCIKLHRKYNK